MPYLSYALFLFLSFVLFACGGGGSSSSTNVIPDDTSNGTLVFNENNNSYAALSLSLAATEGILQSSQSYINRVIHFHSPEGYESEECAAEGTFGIELLDNDTSLSITNGDDLVLNYNNCYDEVYRGTVNGVVRLRIGEFSVSRNGVEIEAQADLGTGLTIVDAEPPNGSTTVLGQFSIAYSLTPGANPTNVREEVESLSAQATGTQFFTFREPEGDENFSEFALLKSNEGNVERTNAITFKLYVDSSYLGGSFTCSTTDFHSNENLPYINCLGLNNNAIRFKNHVSPIEKDEDGDGSFNDSELALPYYSEFLDGFLFEARGYILRQIPEGLETNRLLISARDMKYDPKENRTLLITSDTAAGSSLYSLDDETTQLDKLLEFTLTPLLVRFSNDYSSFYVVFENHNIIKQYASQNAEFIRDIEVDADQIIDLRTSPTIVDEFAVIREKTYIPDNHTTLQSILGITFFNATEELPNTWSTTDYSGFPFRFGNFIYSSDGSHLLVASTNGGGFFRMTLNINGYESLEIRSGYPIRPNTQAIDHLLLSGKYILDDQYLDVRGIVNAENMNYYDVFSNKIYSVGSSKFSVLEYKNQAIIAHYRIANETPFQIIVTPLRVLIREQQLVRVINKDTLVSNQPDSCLLESLTNSDAKPYTSLKCYISDVVYDQHRDKLYVSIGYDNGKNGNSIAVLNSATLAIESYIPLATDPTKLAIAADGSFLYALFEKIETIAKIDLNSNDFAIEFISLSELENNKVGRPVSIFSSPTENNILLVAQRSKSSTVAKLLALNNGSLLPDTVLKEGIPGLREGYIGKGAPFGFNSDGNFYIYAPSDGALSETAPISTFLVDAYGVNYLSTVDVGSIADVNGDVAVHFIKDAVINRFGEYVDLLNETLDQRYDVTLPDNEVGNHYSKVGANTTRAEIYILLVSGEQYLAILRNYDQASGNIKGNFIMPSTYSPRDYQYGKLINVPTGVLFVSTGKGALILVPHEAIGSQ